MRNPLLTLFTLLALGATLASACANSTAQIAQEPVMRLTIQTRGNLETTDPNVRYYVVLNTATQANLPTFTDARNYVGAEASASAGLPLPANAPINQTAGPRGYGPWLRDKPLLGWDLPFYLSGPSATTSTDPRRTISYQDPTPILPVTWTDYYLLSSETGALQLTHAQHPNPVSNPQIIQQYFETLQQGQDYFIKGNQLIINIRLRKLLNGDVYMPVTSPTGAVVAGQGKIVVANFFTSNTQGQIIDRWTLAPDEPGVILRTAPNSQDQQQRFRPDVLNPTFKPSTVSGDSLNLSAYNSEIRL